LELGHAAEVDLGAVEEKAETERNGDHLRVDVHLDHLRTVQPEPLRDVAAAEGPEATSRNNEESCKIEGPWKASFANGGHFAKQANANVEEVLTKYSI